MLLRSILAGAPRSRRSRAAPASAAPPALDAAQAVLRRGPGEPARVRPVDGQRLHAVRATSTSTSTTSLQPSIGPAAGGLRRQRSTGSVLGAVRRERRSASSRCALTEHDNAGEHGHGDLARSRGSRSSRRPRAAATERARALPRPRLHRPARAPGLRALRVRAASRARRSGSACRPATAGSSRSERKQFPFKKSPQVGRLDDPVRPGGRSTTRRPRSRVPLTDQGQAGDQAETGSGSLTRVRSKRRPPSSASTAIGSPAANSPLSRPSASGSTSRLEITRFSGRAPYAGS